MGSEQQFCLRWNNFQHSLLTSLPALLDADDLTDVTLCAGGKSIKAHRVVLSACSHYFKELFREMQPYHHPVIVLPQTTYSDVCALVSFMYSGEVNIYQEQLPSLLAAAAALHIRGLAEVPHAAGVGKPGDSPPCKDAAPKSPPPKRAKVSSASSTPVKSEPQNLSATKSSLDLSDHGSPRFETPPQERLVKMEEEHHHHRGGDSAESSTHNSPDPLPLALHADSGAFGHSTSDDSHGSEADIPEKILHAVNQGLSPSLNHPLNFLPTSSIFSPFTSLARNKLFATCHICGKSLSNQYNLRVHLETHQNLNYSCNLCSHVSRSRDALRKHIAYKHTEGREKYLPRKNMQNSSSTNSSPEDKIVNEKDIKFNNNSQQASSC